MSDRAAIGEGALRAIVAGAAALGLSAVAAGAFGAHALSDPHAKALLQTGGQYGLTHALAAIAALVVDGLGGRRALAAAWCFLAGGAIFSASLYALALTSILWLGAVTPVGGVLMLAGWALLAWSGLTLRISA